MKCRRACHYFRGVNLRAVAAEPIASARVHAAGGLAARIRSRCSAEPPAVGTAELASPVVREKLLVARGPRGCEPSGWAARPHRPKMFQSGWAGLQLQVATIFPSRCDLLPVTNILPAQPVHRQLRQRASTRSH
ncbi:unnamed protein product [Polarella glacialis]|uniref:Uncharacterized protein n=1 Tax=Polarella glacialis TaxID=89957 RepID=A0A813JLY9_POLGL|nr:unnamed protein product [Polarella glacialis]